MKKFSFLNNSKDKFSRLEDRKIKELIEGMLSVDNVDRLISPDTDEYFLIDKVNQINVCLEDRGVRLANHDFLLFVPLTLNVVEDLKKIIRVKIEQDRQILKKQLFKDKLNLINKLHGIYRNHSVPDSELPTT